jgi:hypothetical protein
MAPVSLCMPGLLGIKDTRASQLAAVVPQRGHIGALGGHKRAVTLAAVPQQRPQREDESDAGRRRKATSSTQMSAFERCVMGLLTEADLRARGQHLSHEQQAYIARVRSCDAL